MTVPPYIWCTKHAGTVLRAQDAGRSCPFPTWLGVVEEQLRSDVMLQKIAKTAGYLKAFGDHKVHHVPHVRLVNACKVHSQRIHLEYVGTQHGTALHLNQKCSPMPKAIVATTTCARVHGHVTAPQIHSLIRSTWPSSSTSDLIMLWLAHAP